MTSETCQSLMDLRSRVRLLACVVPPLVLLDQMTKWFAVRYLQSPAPMSWLGDTIRIQYAENEGAFLSLFASLPSEVRFWLLTVMNACILLALLIYLCIGRHNDLRSFVAFTLILAGGIGNLIDRARLNYVIDFMNVGLGSLRTGIFNVADLYITAGFLLLIPLLIFGPARSTPEASSTPIEELPTAR